MKSRVIRHCERSEAIQRFRDAVVEGCLQRRRSLIARVETGSAAGWIASLRSQ